MEGARGGEVLPAAVGTLGGTPGLRGHGAGAGRALRGAAAWPGAAWPGLAWLWSSSSSPAQGEAARRAEHICQLIVCAERRTKRKTTEKNAKCI